MQGRRPTQTQQQSADPLKKQPQLGCSISVMIKIHSPTYPNPKKQDSSKNGKYYLNANIQLDKANNTSLVFHHFAKFDSYEFKFDQIYSQNTRSSDICSQTAISSSMIKEQRDVCVFIIGGGQSGIHDVAEGTNKKDGLFYSIISQIWEQLQRERERDDGKGYNSVKISFKMLVQNNEKLFDVLRPKSDVSLKQSEGRSHITGCSSHQIKSVFDLYSLLQGGFEQRKMIHPDGILIVQVELTLHNEGVFMTDEDISKRYLTLISWQKCTAEQHSHKINNNQSLLTLNMCLYQLYKLSCCNPETVRRSQVKKLFAIFRNSPTTQLMKAYFLNNCRFLLLGCLSLQEKQEHENFHTLMIAKNFGKINLEKFVEQAREKEEKPKAKRLARDSHRKMKTEGVQPSSNSSGVDLSRLKDNLKKILRQKEVIDCSKKRSDLVGIFKEQKRKLKQLQNLRYKREEAKFMEKLNKIHDNLSANNSRVVSQDQKVILPSLEHKRNTPAESVRKIEDLQMLEEVEALEEKMLEKAKEEPNILMRDVLKMQVKKQEEEMVGFIQHKNRLMDILKKQIISIKLEKRPEGQHKKSISYSTEKKPKVQRKTYIIDDLSRKQTNLEESIQFSANPQPNFQASAVLDEPPQKLMSSIQKDMQRLRSLKKFNKVDYLFEKRRLMLKAKVEKGRQQINKFYQEAAQKFQQYRQPKKQSY